MAEAKQKKQKPKKNMRMLKKFLLPEDEDPHNETIQWYLNRGFAALSTEYNQLSDDIFWGKLGLHLCVLDASNFGTRQYSSKGYAGLAKYNPAWIGFYPSTYTVQVTIDEEGNKADKQIADTQQLTNARNLKKAEKFYFAGNLYKTVKVELKHETNDAKGWMLLAEDKESNEGIYIRKTKQAYIIINFALQTNKTGRTIYGSSGNIAVVLGNWCKKVLMDQDADNPYLDVSDDDNDDW